MNIFNDPLYKETAMWNEKSTKLYDYIKILYAELNRLQEQRKITTNPDEKKSLDEQIKEVMQAIEMYTKEMEYGASITEVE